MATILTKKKDTTGAPSAGDLTNSTGGAELAVNTADKRLYTKDSGGNVVEIGTAPSTIDINAGTIDGAAIGANSASTGAFTTLTASGQTTVTGNSASTPAVSPVGDTNTGIFFPAADTIAFAEGGAEAMRIDSSGNVGIGTTSPAVSGLEISRATGSASPTPAELRIRTTTNAGDWSTTVPWGRLSFYSADTSTGGAKIHSSIDVVSEGVGGGLSNVAFNRAITSGGTLSKYFEVVGASDHTAIFYRNTTDESMRINSSGNVGIGTSSPDDITTNYTTVDVRGSVGGGLRLGVAGGNNMALYASATTSVIEAAGSADLQFVVSSAERARITSGGQLFIGKTADNFGTAGVNLQPTGECQFTRSSGAPLLVNRTTDDGDLVIFYQAGTQEGTISVSGNTVSYNAFSGGHWSQLQEGRGYNPDIPRGTVMSTIGEMCLWKSVEWTETTEHPAIPAVEAKEAVLDEEGNVIEPAVEAVEGKDAWTETFDKRETYFGDLPVGATFEEDGFTKTVVDDGNERLPKVKISDVVGDKAVYGVFQTWDEAQDMLVTSLGAFVVRIAAGVTVEIGDLLESNGDGCAKVQDDDVIRSKTIAKVTSTTPTATYDDGSYTVPAVIYCG